MSVQGFTACIERKVRGGGEGVGEEEEREGGWQEEKEEDEEKGGGGDRSRHCVLN